MKKNHRGLQGYIYKFEFMRVGLKSSYDDVISTVDIFSVQLDSSTSTAIEVVCLTQGGLFQ